MQRAPKPDFPAARELNQRADDFNPFGRRSLAVMYRGRPPAR
jgi:hypothetical protein